MYKILSRIVEIKETKDSKEAALLLQSGNWLAFGAAFQGNEIVWALGRITNQTPMDALKRVPGFPDIEGSHHTTQAHNEAFDDSIQADACRKQSCND